MGTKTYWGRDLGKLYDDTQVAAVPVPFFEVGNDAASHDR